MNYDLMSFDSYFLVVCLLWTIQLASADQATIYVKQGGTIELCDNRTTTIYAYEYRSIDGEKNFIVEPNKHQRYSNPYSTSLLRIKNAVETDTGFYKCPQDDTEWQLLQVYVPARHIYLSNLDVSSRAHSQSLCENQDQCLTMVEGEPLNVVCAADGFPRPAVELSFDKNGTKPIIMALASEISTPNMINDQFKPSVYETYRIAGLTSEDNGRNITCQVDMKQIDKRLILSTSKQLRIEFRPVVGEKSKKIYCGINQTRTINCTVLRANPKYIRYAIHGLSPFVQRRIHDVGHEFFYTFDITPTSLDQFRPFNVTVNNSIGYDTCTYELIHGGVPDPISDCAVDNFNSNITRTITISCTKSYAQGDNDNYACTLFKYNDKPNRKMFEEIARTKSCIFALENSYEPVELRVAAFNRYGSLPVNTNGYTIRLNQPTQQRDTPTVHKKFLLIAGCICGGILFLCFLLCICPRSNERNNYTNKMDLNGKNRDATVHLTPDGIEKRSHQNGSVYDTPSYLMHNKYSNPISSTPNGFDYHQQKPQHLSNNYFADQDPLIRSSNSNPIRMLTANNKFYGQPIIDSKYEPFPLSKNGNFQSDEGDDSPVYSTTADALSENGSFLVPTSMNRHTPPAPKPRYSTVGSHRSSTENGDKTPFVKPRSRSNSRTRLNNPHSDNTSYFYEERPASSSDSGIGQLDVVFLSNGDTIRSGLVQSGLINSQQSHTVPTPPPHPVKFQSLTSSVLTGTEC